MMPIDQVWRVCPQFEDEGVPRALVERGDIVHALGAKDNRVSPRELVRRRQPVRVSRCESATALRRARIRALHGESTGGADIDVAGIDEAAPARVVVPLEAPQMERRALDQVSLLDRHVPSISGEACTASRSLARMSGHACPKVRPVALVHPASWCRNSLRW